MRSAIHSWSEDAFNVEPLEAFELIDLAEGYSAIPLPAHHVPERVCLNYVIQAPGGERLLYATDTGFWEERTFNFLQERSLAFDTVIMEATNGRIDDDSIHLSVDGIMKMRERLIAQGNIDDQTPYYATHFSHGGRLLHGDFEEALSAANILPAFDGLSISV